ncbi:MAG: hypothetical protein PHU97_12115 [Bacteroidales bacterium]|nr:hypothetical protein [Bacteroidales bacterium]
MKPRCILFFFLLFWVPFVSEAQIDTFSDTSLAGQNIIYRKAYSGAVVIHSMGFGAGFRKAKSLNAFEKRFWEADLILMKQLKEIKTTNPWYANSKSYVYGKLNDVIVTRFGFGVQRQISRKPYWGGVELVFSYSGGASVAIAKPVYLYVIEFTNASQLEYTRVVRKYDPDQHFYDNIFGRAPFSEGLAEVSVYPGLYGKAGVSFDFGQYATSISALELGFTVDLFPIAIPVMAFNYPVNLFATLYLSFSLGKRYN